MDNVYVLRATIQAGRTNSTSLARIVANDMENGYGFKVVSMECELKTITDYVDAELVPDAQDETETEIETETENN